MLTVKLASTGWGNKSAAASPRFIDSCNRALLANKPRHVLECGSGLTTLFAGFLAKKNGFEVVVFEDDPRWRERIKAVLSSAGAGVVDFPSTPITTYGAFDWYDVSELDLPHFELVICDGPRGTTMGGRYGLLPVMGSRIADATILLDDAMRPGERTVVERWRLEHDATVDLDLELGRGLAIVRLGRRTTTR